MCNVRDMNNPVKQNNIIRWYKETNNLIFIVTETKLKGKIRPWIMNKFDSIRVFTSGLDSGYIGSGVAIVMNISLAKHIYRVSEVPGRLLSIKLLFKNKLSVSILGLYADASLIVQFSQTSEVNFLIAKAVNKSFFIILGSDFNKNGLCKSASFKRCLDLELVNFLSGSLIVKSPTWENLRGVKKTIDFVLILFNLVNTVVDHNVVNMSKHFNTDYWAVSVFVGLGSLLDTQLNSLHRQANRDCWKFDFRGANDSKWKSFRNVTSANAKMFANKFAAAVQLSDLDVIDFLRFYRLELLVFKLVKTFRLVSSSLFLLDSNFDTIRLALIKVKKFYHSSKLLEFKHAEETSIKAAINKRIESFESDKDHTIRSILEHFFCKVVLNYLVVGDELVLEPSLVKSKVDEIMEDWTRKCRVMSNISNEWSYQYWPLEYVFNSAFSGVMCPVGVNELLGVVSDLPKSKAVGLFGILNELWKHCDKSVLVMLLVLLNSFLICESIPDGILMNTQPIVLIETAYKILSKILLDRISSVCSTFDVLCGDNFLVLKSTTTQSLIFAIGSVIENALEKGCELWLVLQNMRKAYDLIMTDFGLTDGYKVHNGLDQRKMDGCGYRLNSYFISGCGHAESQAGLSSFFITGAFVDYTIWVGSSRSTTQYILNIASKFFDINNISINNNKTVAILINCKIADPSLLISKSPIFIVKKEESHHYLRIYLSTKGLSKLSLAKAHSDVWFFANLVLKKAVSDKQFSYLVLAVLFFIVGYRTQFSYVPVNACKKWNTLIHKGLKSKSGLPCDFPSDAIYHPSLYDLKTFEQIQAENKSASVLCWCLFYLLQYPVRVKVNSLNNFLAGMVHIFSECDLFLGGSLTDAFCCQGETFMSCVLGESTYFKCNSCWTKMGLFLIGIPLSNGSEWTCVLSVQFLSNVSSLSVYSLPLDGGSSSNILYSCEFSAISANLLCSDVGCLSVYMDGFLSGLRSVDMKAGTAVFFRDISMSLGAIALALKCVSSSCSINLFSDSQAALDAYKLELVLVCPDFRNWCWIECCHIVIWVFWAMSVRMSWPKLQLSLAELCPILLLSAILELVDVFQSVYYAHWEIGSGLWMVVDSLYANIDWFRLLLTAGFQMYFMKTLHFRLLVAMCKWLYNKSYPNVVCLFCSNVEVLDHAFFCSFDANVHARLLDSHASAWSLLFTYSFDILVNTALCKSFVFKNWFHESVSIFKDSKVASQNIVAFVHEFSHAFGEDIWLIYAKHHAFMENNRLILCDGSVSISISGLPLVLSVGMIGLLSIAKTIGIGFGFCKSCLFFSSISNEVSVLISI
ncbi:hypothetical protein G9A89_020309 [Geosiphon pyriformis]|nr:hypothetical protein G9A89_020309 [Geosiphon pyriformis]